MENDAFGVSDEEIVKMLLAREERAIDLSERKYGKYLFLVAMNILGDEQDSRECVNDALLLLWTHVPPDRPVCFKAYIARLTRNLALDRAKKDARQKRVPSEYVSALDELAGYLEDPTNVEKEYDRVLLKECLDSFVRSLNERDRFVFVCRYFGYFSVQKIAQMLGVSERQVFKNLDRIKKRLKEQLEKEGFDDAQRGS